MNRKILLASALLVGTAHLYAQESLRTFDFKAYLNDLMKEDCNVASGTDPVYISGVEYFDFDGDGKEEALITASSCMTGTAGPDIHSVYRSSESGGVQKMRVHESTESVKVVGTPLELIGNRNWEIGVNKGKLSYRFYDGSNRPNPLEWLFELEDGEFYLKEVIHGPVYVTSFDCLQATSDREIAVCGNPELATLDLELDGLYQGLIKKLPRINRQSLRDDQRAWLWRIDKTAIYKHCCDELAESYRKRIEYLNSK